MPINQKTNNNRLSNIRTALLILVTLFLFVNANYAQEINSQKSVRDYENSRRHINQTGMMVLGGWALANIAAGAFGNFNSSGESKYFWQFNAMWNTVNLGIAAFGYFGNAPLGPSEQITLSETLKEYSSLQNILLLNAGLDAAYITAGFLLREKSKSSTKNAERLRGYGNSLILQGAFLLAFDIALYFINLNHANVYLYPMIGSVADGQFGLGMQLKL